MPALINQDLDASMGARVIDYLNNYSKLPDQGIVAGQAVASALYDLFGDGVRRGPINDIDIFAAKKNGVKDRFHSSFDLTKTTYKGKVPIRVQNENFDYQVINSYNFHKTKVLKIGHVSNDGLLNIIACNPGRDFLSGSSKHKLSAQEVITSFDLNCVEVAVDLETKKLSWSREFAQFIHSQQLKLTNIHGELHSLIRMQKKMAEMPWMYCNMEASALAMQHSYNLKVLKTQFNGESSKSLPTMGPKYKARYDALGDSVSQYFGIEENTLETEYSQLYVPISQKDIRDDDFKFLRSPLIDRYLEDPKSIRHKLILTGEINMSTFNVIQKTYQQYEKISKKTSDHLAMVQDILKKRRDEKIEKIKKDKPDNIYALDNASLQETAMEISLKSLGPDYVKTGQISEKNIDKVNDFLEKHPDMGQYLADCTLEDQVKMVTIFRELENETDGVAIGVLEVSGSNFKRYGPEVLLDKDSVRNIVMGSLKASEEKKIIEKLPELEVSKQYANQARIVELDTLFALKKEGKRMSHCVGGYFDMVARGDCRIYSITSGPSVKDASTLEIYLESSNSGVTVKKNQLKGFANGIKPKLHEEIAEAIIQEHQSILDSHAIHKVGHELQSGTISQFTDENGTIFTAKVDARKTAIWRNEFSRGSKVPFISHAKVAESLSEIKLQESNYSVPVTIYEENKSVFHSKKAIHIQTLKTDGKGRILNEAIGGFEEILRSSEPDKAFAIGTILLQLNRDMQKGQSLNEMIARHATPETLLHEGNTQVQQVQEHQQAQHKAEAAKQAITLMERAQRAKNSLRDLIFGADNHHSPTRRP